MEKNYLSFLILLQFIFVGSISAETLMIEVLEKGSGVPVADATVVVKQNGDYDNTDEEGKVSFDEVSLPIDIKVLNAGYETLEQKVDGKAAKIYIEPLSFDSETIEVVEERIKEKVSKIVLNKQELRNVAGTQGDPIKMIETLPGVVQASSGGDGGGNPNNIYVRGSSGGENSFWVNRIPIDYLYHVWGLSIINPSLVDNFNVFLGGFPVEYDDVLGGVVDIQLRRPKTDRIHQTYRVAINESAALIEGPINDKQSFYVAARASYIDKVLDPFKDDISDFLNSDDESESEVSIITLPKYWDAQANWHYRLPKGSMDLYYFGSNDGLAIDIKELDTSDPELIGKLDFDYGFHSIGFNIQSSVTPGLTGMLTTSIKQGHTKFTRGRDENGTPFGIDIKITEALFQPQLIFSLSNSQEITVGGQALLGYYPVNAYSSSFPTEENFTQGSFTDRKKYKVDENLEWVSASPYAKWRWTWNKFTTTLGGRYSKVRGTGGIDLEGFSPRASLEYQVDTNLLLTGGWGKYIQVPNPAQLVKGYGNPSLEFTEAEHRILGFNYKLAPLWSIQVEAYHKPMTNLVLTRPTQEPPNTYKNDGQGEAYGLDLLLKRDYGNRRMGWLSYSYARSSRTIINGGERDFSGDQPHTLSVVWSEPFKGEWKKWSWGFKFQAGSGRPYTPVVGRVAMCSKSSGIDVCPDQKNANNDADLSHWSPIYGKRNILRRPFFHQLDLRVDRLIRYNTWTLKLYMDLLNVTMQELGFSDDYGKDYENYNNPKKSGFPAIILPFFGVEATF